MLVTVSAQQVLVETFSIPLGCDDAYLQIQRRKFTFFFSFVLPGSGREGFVNALRTITDRFVLFLSFARNINGLLSSCTFCIRAILIVGSVVSNREYHDLQKRLIEFDVWWAQLIILRDNYGLDPNVQNY